MKIKIVETDQWTSTGNVTKFTLEDFEREEALDKIQGGDSEASRSLGIASGRVKEVDENARPRIGNVWFKPGESGKLELWKSNYDSSD